MTLLRYWFRFQIALVVILAFFEMPVKIIVLLRSKSYSSSSSSSLLLFSDFLAANFKSELALLSRLCLLFGSGGLIYCRLFFFGEISHGKVEIKRVVDRFYTCADVVDVTSTLLSTHFLSEIEGWLTGVFVALAKECFGLLRCCRIDTLSHCRCESRLNIYGVFI